jgi:hypothetical protein
MSDIQYSHPSINQNRGNSPKSPDLPEVETNLSQSYGKQYLLNNEIDTFKRAWISGLSTVASFGDRPTQRDIDITAVRGLVYALASHSFGGSQPLMNILYNNGAGPNSFTPWSLITSAYFDDVSPDNCNKGWNPSSFGGISYSLVEGAYVRVPIEKCIGPNPTTERLLYIGKVESIINTSIKSMFDQILTSISLSYRENFLSDISDIFNLLAELQITNPTLVDSIKNIINSQITNIANKSISKSFLENYRSYLMWALGVGPGYLSTLADTLSSLINNFNGRESPSSRPIFTDEQMIEYLAHYLTTPKTPAPVLPYQYANFGDWSQDLINQSRELTDEVMDTIFLYMRLLLKTNLPNSDIYLQINNIIIRYELYQVAINNLRTKLLDFYKWLLTPAGQKALAVVVPKKCGPKFKIYNPIKYALEGKKEYITRSFDNNMYGRDSDLPSILSGLIPNFNIEAFRLPDGELDVDALRNAQRVALIAQDKPVWAELVGCDCSQCPDGYSSPDPNIYPVYPEGLEDNKNFDHFNRCIKCCEDEIVTHVHPDNTKLNENAGCVNPPERRCLGTSVSQARKQATSLECSCTLNTIKTIGLMPCFNGCEKPNYEMENDPLTNVVYKLFVVPKKRKDGLTDEMIKNNYSKVVCADRIPPDTPLPLRGRAISSSREYINALKNSQYEWDADKCEWVCKDYVFQQVPPYYWYIDLSDLARIEYSEEQIRTYCERVARTGIWGPPTECVEPKEWKRVPDPDWTVDDLKPRFCKCICEELESGGVLSTNKAYYFNTESKQWEYK